MQHTKWEAMDLLAEAGVPCSAVFDTEDVLHDPHLQARNMIRTISHPEAGDWEMLAPPIHMSESEVEMVRAPLLGEHTAEILQRELGLTPAEVEVLAAAKVAGVRKPANSQPA